jgi:single-stranded-DNA-specific exonuclease
MRIPPLPLTRWQIPEPRMEDRDHLVRELRMHPVLCNILVSRSLRDPDEAKRFLTPTLKDLHNPFLMSDMKRGLDRVIRAIHHREKILIFGDYDVDGVTALVTLYKFLAGVGVDVTYSIPDRIKEGYGLNRAAVDRIRQSGNSLLITVDCGVSNHDEIEYAKSLGLDTIVLDHHEVPDHLPDAIAVINTHRNDCLFPFKHLAGVGIVFNFLIALRGALRETGFWSDKPYPNLMEYLDLVALGTIGDISPLIDENRIFAKIGLDLMNKNKRHPGPEGGEWSGGSIRRFNDGIFFTDSKNQRRGACVVGGRRGQTLADGRPRRGPDHRAKARHMQSRAAVDGKGDFQRYCGWHRRDV